MHRGQYNSIPSARHLSCTRHSFFRHHGHSAQLPFILAFTVLFPIFPSLFESFSGFDFGLCALYSAIPLQRCRPRFSGWGRGVPPQFTDPAKTPTTTPRAANSPGLPGYGCLLHVLHNHSCNSAEYMPQLNKITILLILQNPETIGNQGLSDYA